MILLLGSALLFLSCGDSGDTELTLADYSELFQQNVMESALGRQLQAAVGAGQFGNQEQALQMQFLLPMLQAGLTAGGAFTQPAIMQDPGFFGNVVSPLLQMGATAASFIPGPHQPFTAAATQTGAQSGGGAVVLPMNPPQMATNWDYKRPGLRGTMP